MKCKILLIGLMIILVFPLVLGDTQTSLGTFKKDSNIQLSQYCANCTYINLSSIKSPIGLYILQGEYEMTKSGSDYYYNFSNTNILGEYIYCVHGDPDGKDTAACSNFFITTEGLNLSNYIVLLIVLIFAYLILVLGIWKEEIVFVTLGAMGIIILGVYININGISDVRSWMTNAFGIINWGIGCYVLVSAYGSEAMNQLGN
jgi:hypothetical protein